MRLDGWSLAGEKLKNLCVVAITEICVTLSECDLGHLSLQRGSSPRERETIVVKLKRSEGYGFGSHRFQA